MAILTGFDGRNAAVSFDAVELKVLLSYLKFAADASATDSAHDITARTANFITSEGYLYSPEEVNFHVQHSYLILRNLLSQVNNHPEDDDETTEVSKRVQ